MSLPVVLLSQSALLCIRHMDGLNSSLELRVFAVELGNSDGDKVKTTLAVASKVSESGNQL